MRRAELPALMTRLGKSPPDQRADPEQLSLRGPHEH